MENWSIFTDKVKYIHHDEKNLHRLYLNTLDYWLHKELYCKLKGEEGDTLDIDFGINPETLKTNYLDVYMRMYMQKWSILTDLMRILTGVQPIQARQK